jgi:hypothetical protein
MPTNARFPIVLGKRGTSNPRVIAALSSGRLGYTWAGRHLHIVRVRFGGIDFTPAAATSQNIDLNAIAGFAPFPQDTVRRLPGTYAWVETGIAGTSITVANITIGDENDPDGLLTSSSALPAAEGLVVPTPGAAENVARPETAFAPVLRVSLTGGNMTALTTGVVWTVIPFMPIPSP